MTLQYNSLYICGQWTAPSTADIITAISASTEEILGTVPHARPADDAQIWRGLDDFPGDFGFGAHDQGVNILDQRQQGGFVRFLLQDRDFEFGPLLQQRDAFGRNRITNQNIHKMDAQCRPERSRGQ